MVIQSFIPRPANETNDDVCDKSAACSPLARLQEHLAELERRVATDSLTGHWNRAHFDHVVDSELDRSLRYKQPVSLILLDIDHFKRVNDVFGHQAGDAVLRELAGLAGAAIRSSDALFRWGGEEFAVLAATTGYRSAGKLADALREKVACHGFPIVGAVTISLGVAEHMAGESAQVWFGRADAMLYAAKREGRNRVRVDARGNSELWAAAQGPAALHLAWQEAYECGEPTIDREHRELFDLANALLDSSLGGGNDPARVASAFQRLMEHIAAHFAHEEALLAQRGYARLEAHRRIHAGLLARACELQDAIAAGGANLGGVVEFLARDVVARHIFKADRDFFPLFAAGNGTDQAGTSFRE